MWGDFVAGVRSVYTHASVGLIEKLHYALGKYSSYMNSYNLGNSDRVEKQLFRVFLEWFHPLGISMLYQTNSDQIEIPGYDLEQISQIVGPSWFFGFMTASEAKELLLKKPHGSYLFRFSSNAGCYALSVNYGQVGHWRITTEKKGDADPVFRIDGRPYPSLQAVIQTHQIGGTPLIVKGSSVTNCFLREAVDRNNPFGKVDRNYEAMY